MKNVLSKIKKLFVSLFTTIKSALFVKDIKCIACSSELDKPNKYCMCEDCFAKLPYNNGHICYKCGTNIVGSGSYCLNCKDSQKDYEFARAPFIYGGVIQTLIYKLKYSRGKYLANYLSLFLVDEFIKTDWQIDAVVPVPLYIKREKKRGFNQATLLSSQFESVLNIPVISNNLVRLKNTPTQTKLTKIERKNNLDKAFKVLDKKEFKGKNVLLIDDVFTTGATTDECSKVLKSVGVKNIYVLTLAHVKLDIPMY
ncbi:MAG: ComF family protein [Clostridia bacterium]|nr:ComF family protein [Clostridia bacterium]